MIAGKEMEEGSKAKAVTEEREGGTEICYNNL